MKVKTSVKAGSGLIHVSPIATIIITGKTFPRDLVRTLQRLSHMPESQARPVQAVCGTFSPLLRRCSTTVSTSMSHIPPTRNHVGTGPSILLTLALNLIGAHGTYCHQSTPRSQKAPSDFPFGRLSGP